MATDFYMIKKHLEHIVLARPKANSDIPNHRKPNEFQQYKQILADLE